MQALTCLAGLSSFKTALPEGSSLFVGASSLQMNVFTSLMVQNLFIVVEGSLFKRFTKTDEDPIFFAVLTGSEGSAGGMCGRYWQGQGSVVTNGGMQACVCTEHVGILGCPFLFDSGMQTDVCTEPVHTLGCPLLVDGGMQTGVCTESVGLLGCPLLNKR